MFAKTVVVQEQAKGDIAGIHGYVISLYVT